MKMRKLVCVGALMTTLLLQSFSWAANVINCTDGIARAIELNGGQLVRAAELCTAEKRKFDSAFLLDAAQVRSGADVEVLVALNDVDQIEVEKLVKLLAVTLQVGLEDPDIRANPNSATALVQQLDEWNPRFDDKYNPGWKYRMSVRPDRYNELLDRFKQRQLSILERRVLLTRNDTYYAASVELRELEDKIAAGSA